MRQFGEQSAKEIGMSAVVVCVMGLLAGGSMWMNQEGPVGYDDTPVLPGMPWRVHDKNRPVPPARRPPPSRARTRASV